MKEIHTFLNASYPDFESTKFHADFKALYDLFTNSAHDTNTSPKLTIYLWDNLAMIEYIRGEILIDKIENSLNKIMMTIRNHVSEFHYPTQMILNGDRLTAESLAENKLRMSALDVFEVVKYLMLTNLFFKLFKSIFLLNLIKEIN